MRRCFPSLYCKNVCPCIMEVQAIESVGILMEGKLKPEQLEGRVASLHRLFFYSEISFLRLPYAITFLFLFLLLSLLCSYTSPYDSTHAPTQHHTPSRYTHKTQQTGQYCDLHLSKWQTISQSVSVDCFQHSQVTKWTRVFNWMILYARTFYCCSE